MTNREIPRNIEAEAALVGGLMYFPDHVADVMSVVEPQDFFKPAYGHIFQAITDLFVEGDSPEAIAVGELLKARGLLDTVGGSGGIMSLLNLVGAPSGLMKLAELVHGKALLRRLIEAGAEIQELGLANTEDPDEVVSRAEELVLTIGEQKAKDSAVSASYALRESLDKMETLISSTDEILGLRTGFQAIDKMTSGLSPGEFVVLGARPSMGKTALAQAIAYHASVIEGAPTLLFSLEMSKDEIIQRAWASEGLVPLHSIKNANMMESHFMGISQVTRAITGSPLWIDDNPSVTISDIRAKARKFHSRHGGLGLIVIDYLQLMTGRNGAESRQVEVSEISRGCKILARDLECPVLALSQLSRNLENRADKRPSLADLRESGSIEQDADTVMFLYRDEIYVDDSEYKGTAEVIIAKQRSGPVGKVRLGFSGQHAKFLNLAS